MQNLLKAKSEFRKKGVNLLADKQKSGGGGSWKFASEDNFVTTVQAPLSECGLEIIATMKYLAELGVDTVEITLYHIESGESISSIISLPAVTPKKDRNGNDMYLDAEIERGKQFGYWSRTLAIRILGLSDIDPENVNNRPVDLTINNIADMNTIKDGLDLLNKDDVAKAKDKVMALYSREVDEAKKNEIKKYGLELKGVLDGLNQIK